MARQKRKKTRSQLEAEIRMLKQVRNSAGVAAVIKAFLRYGSYTACCFFIADAVKALSGHVTDANIVVDLLGNLTLNTTIAWSLFIICVLWAFSERNLRQKKTSYFGERNADLERMIDTKRSSSNLSVSGKTNPKDKDE